MERDKFLTEAMGECWHSVRHKSGLYAFPYCRDCGEEFDLQNNNFSTWQGFGKLWEWAKEQEWWVKYRDTLWSSNECQDFDNLEHFIHPDRFADAVYKFLKESNHDTD